MGHVSSLQWRQELHPGGGLGKTHNYMKDDWGGTHRNFQPDPQCGHVGSVHNNRTRHYFHLPRLLSSEFRSRANALCLPRKLWASEIVTIFVLKQNKQKGKFQKDDGC